MQRENRWLLQVMSLKEDTPYHSSLTTKVQHSDTKARPVAETATVEGITVFHLENGILCFQFFVSGNGRTAATYEAFAARNMMLGIPACGFNHPIEVIGLSGDASTLSGFVDVKFFGENNASLSGMTVHFIGFPEKWHGTDKWSYYEVMSTEQVQVQENDTVVIPKGRLGARALSGFTLKADGWTARLREIPISHRTNPRITHVCNLTNENRPLTGAMARDFLDEDLFPFLSFVFGQHARFHTIVGYKDGIDLWVRTSPQRETPLSTLQGNWFLRTWYDPTDLSLLFQHFYDLDPDVKKHWGKVIYQYANSEEIMGTLGESALAASVSFAALEGLTRSIISTYPCKDEWLKDDLSLKNGKGIKNAVEMVAKREFDRHSQTFREASEQIYTVRNATFHADLTSDEDPINAYHRWNASQALVEILLLSQMGLEKIPNRTAHGTFNVMGKDMYEDIRKEELNFG